MNHQRWFHHKQTIAVAFRVKLEALLLHKADVTREQADWEALGAGYQQSTAKCWWILILRVLLLDWLVVSGINSESFNNRR